MSTTTVNIGWTGSTFAAWKATIQAFSAALAAVNVNTTTDTGQINWSTLTAYPAAVNTAWVAAGGGSGEYYLGYEIRQLVAPGLPTIYLRFDYGVSINAASLTNPSPSGPASGTRPLIKMTSATATDGAGNLTGTVNVYWCKTLSCSYNGQLNGVVYQNGSNATVYAATSIPRPMMVASDGANYLTVLIDPLYNGSDCGAGQPTYGGGVGIAAFCLERTISPGNGAYNNTGWITVDVGGNSSMTSGVGDSKYGYSVLNAQMATLVHTTASLPFQTVGTLYNNSGTGNNCNIFPLTVVTPAPQGPASAVFSYFAADIAPGMQFQMSVYGAQRNYFAIGPKIANANICNPANSAIYSPAMRFD